MNDLRMRLAAVVVFTFMFASQLAFGQEKNFPSQKDQMKSVQNMPMDQQTMKDCMQHHQAAMKSIDEITNMMDEAKQSNDPAKMRATLDQSQKQLSEMKEHMAMCGNMMSMMEKMQGGMMKGGSK